MNKRCEKILEMLNNAKAPITATQLAEYFGVSRQAIVGDVAILRAAGYSILATSRGYKVDVSKDDTFAYTGILTCKHDDDGLKDELYTMVDFGATVIDVTVEHAIYGELTGRLDLSSRYDVDEFLRKVREDKNSSPISSLTGGIHLHRVGCQSKDIFNKIKNALTEKGIAFE